MPFHSRPLYHQVIGQESCTGFPKQLLLSVVHCTETLLNHSNFSTVLWKQCQHELPFYTTPAFTVTALLPQSQVPSPSCGGVPRMGWRARAPSQLCQHGWAAGSSPGWFITLPPAQKALLLQRAIHLTAFEYSNSHPGAAPPTFCLARPAHRRKAAAKLRCAA